MWIVVNIGCLECEVPSKIVGAFSCEERAYQIATELQGDFSLQERGHNVFQVFEMPEPDLIQPEYSLRNR